MSRCHTKLLNLLFLSSAVFHGVFAEMGEFFERTIPMKFRNLSHEFEAKHKSAVYQCSKEVNAVVYGVSTAFRENGNVHCDCNISIANLKVIRCHIPIKIQWLRAKVLDGSGDEFFFRSLTGSIDHQIGVGIEGRGLMELLQQLSIDEEASNFRDEVNSNKRESLINCASSGLQELAAILASILT